MPTWVNFSKNLQISIGSRLSEILNHFSVSFLDRQKIRERLKRLMPGPGDSLFDQFWQYRWCRTCDTLTGADQWLVHSDRSNLLDDQSASFFLLANRTCVPVATNLYWLCSRLDLGLVKLDLGFLVLASVQNCWMRKTMTNAVGMLFRHFPSLILNINSRVPRCSLHWRLTSTPARNIRTIIVWFEGFRWIHVPLFP